MVVENDNSDHHSQTKHHRLFSRELAPVLPITTITQDNKKLSYPQRKHTSNMALLYAAKGISI